MTDPALPVLPVPPTVPPTQAPRNELSVVARGGTLNLAGAVLSGALTFAFYVLVARSLDQAEVGAFFVATGIFTIAATTCMLGAHAGLVRYIPRFRVQARYADLRPMLRVALVPVLLCSTAAGIALYLGADALAGHVSNGQDPDLVRDDLRQFAPFIPALSTFTVLIAGLQGFGSMRPSVLVDKVGRTTLQVLLALPALLVGGSIVFVAAWAVPYAVGVVIAALWLLRLMRREAARPGEPGEPAKPLRPLARDFWSFSGPRGIASLFQVLVLWLDTVLIAVLATTEEAGIYAVATRYLLIGTMAVGALVQVIGPKVSELFARGDTAALHHVYQGSVAWLMAIVWPIYLVMAIFGSTLLTLFGQEYVRAAGTLALLALALLFATACGPVDIVLLMAGRSWYSVGNWGLALVVNVGLDLWLIPEYGMFGAAIAWSASIVVRNLAPLVEVAVLFGLHPFGPGFRAVLIASVLAYGGVAGAVRLTLGDSLGALVAAVVLGTAVYGVLTHRWRTAIQLDVLRQTLLRRTTGREAQRTS